MIITKCKIFNGSKKCVFALANLQAHIHDRVMVFSLFRTMPLHCQKYLRYHCSSERENLYLIGIVINCITI
jgi:hypothetical protein